VATAGQRVGRFEVVEEIGRGGMAVVYRARQLDLGRFVALKELPAFHAADPAFAERFLREARIAGSLSHPNVVVVYEYLESDGTPFIAMEYVERGSLRPLVGELSLAQVGGVLEGVLSALSHAEGRQVVHRDLKPENLMVSGDGAVKIADFGIAKAVGAVASGRFLTATGTAVGTPTYMAPEQALGQDVTAATDLYAVGVIAYELLVGRAPFPAQDTPMAVLFSHVHDPPPPARALQPGLDAGLETWLSRMLAKAPADRPPGARAAWEELEEVLIGVLGARWRRAARLLEIAPGESDAKPLTPAPFHETPEDDADGGGGFVTFLPAGRAAAPPASPPTPATRAPATPTPETPAPDPEAPLAPATPAPLAEAAESVPTPPPVAAPPEVTPEPTPEPAFETFRPAAAAPPPAPPPPVEPTPAPPAVSEPPEPAAPEPSQAAAPAAAGADHPAPPAEEPPPEAAPADVPPDAALSGAEAGATPASALTVPPAVRQADAEPEPPGAGDEPPAEHAVEPPPLPPERRSTSGVPTRLVAGVLGAVAVLAAGIGYAAFGRGGSHATTRAATSAVVSAATGRTSTQGATSGAPAPAPAPVAPGDRLGLDYRGGSLFVTDPARGLLVAYATAPGGAVSRLRVPVAPTAVAESGTNRSGFIWVTYARGILRVGAARGALLLTGQADRPTAATGIAGDTSDPVAAISRSAVCVASAPGRAPDACADAGFGALSIVALPAADGGRLWLVGGADGRIHAYARGADGVAEVQAGGADLGAPVERLAVWARAGAPPCVLAYAAPAIRRLCLSGSSLVAQDQTPVRSEPASLFVLRDTAGGDTAAHLYAAFPGQGVVGVYDAGTLKTPVVLVPGLGRPVAVTGSASGTATDRHAYVADAAGRRVVALADSAPTDRAVWRVYPVPAATSAAAVAGAASFGGGQQPTVTIPLAPGHLDASGLVVRDARIGDGSAVVELRQAGIARGPRAGGRTGDVAIRVGAGGPNVVTVRVTVPPGAYTSFAASLRAGGSALLLRLVKAPPAAPTGGSPPPPSGGAGGGGGGGGAGGGGAG
jgi:hypothetical protein